MEFRIADTLTDSLARLTGDEQKAVKQTAFDLQIDPASTGMQFHKLDGARDKNFWSVRVNQDIRIIVHRSQGSLLLCYVDHHDKAYTWAERRKLETHPKTGAAQIVEIRETVREIVVPRYVDAPAVGTALAKPPIFEGYADDTLLGYGVPADWLGDVRAATEDTILDIAEHLPAEAADALIAIAAGGQPAVAASPPAASLDVRAARPEPMEFPANARIEGRVATPAFTNALDHPDAQRRFLLVTNIEELERALDYPWDKWTVFLHPEQRQIVERDYSGPARVSGSAGTGKTIVALHRAVHLARRDTDARVLLTTFSDTLANALRGKLRRLVGNEPRLGERIDVESLRTIGLRLYKANVGSAKLAAPQDILSVLRTAAADVPGHKFGMHFLFTEWDQVVDAWQLDGWEAYRDVARLGRKTRLPEKQRSILWAIFQRVCAGLHEKGAITEAALFSRLAGIFAGDENRPFEFVVVYEAQDLSIAQLRFLAALGAARPDGLFFAGDLGQRIFQQPYSWLALGVDIRGRARTLRVNYRTSHQIRMQADRLLGPELSDVDGNLESRRDTVSVFNGPPPEIKTFASPAQETEAVAAWISKQVRDGAAPHEVAVFVRSPLEIDRAKAALEKASQPFKVLDDQVETTSGFASVCTMHLAKGLEFRAVAVMACDDEVIPLQQRVESVGDDADLQEVYDTERHLLYVACTRARDHLLVTGVDPASEFLDDLRA